MRHLALLLASTMVMGWTAAAAQAVGPRSSDYLFVSTIADVRAIWSNPAGLQLGAFASIMGELVVDRATGDGARLSQWSVGLSARGLALGYQRDRLASDSSNQALRIGAGTVFSRGAIGLAGSFYTSDSTSRALDVGLQYILLRPVRLGLVVRNIGKPYVRGTRLPVTGIAGLSWAGLAGRLLIAGEALAADRSGRSGFDVHYRAGTHLSMGRRLPLSGMVSVTLASGFDVLSWTVGFAVGADRRAVALATLTPADGSPDVDALSITGVALNRDPARR